MSVQTRLIPVNDWPKFHIWPTALGMRHFIFHRDDNGFNKVMRRVGRRILIDEQAFFEWVNTVGKVESEKPKRRRAPKAVAA